jgi:hypothetical protein
MRIIILRLKKVLRTLEELTTRYSPYLVGALIILSVSLELLSLGIETETNSLSLPTILKDVSIFASWIAILLSTSPFLSTLSQERPIKAQSSGVVHLPFSSGQELRITFGDHELLRIKPLTLKIEK